MVESLWGEKREQTTIMRRGDHQLKIVLPPISLLLPAPLHSLVILIDHGRAKIEGASSAERRTCGEGSFVTRRTSPSSRLNT
jgi:hypothetical protein